MTDFTRKECKARTAAYMNAGWDTTEDPYVRNIYDGNFNSISCDIVEPNITGLVIRRPLGVYTQATIEGSVEPTEVWSIVLPKLQAQNVLCKMVSASEELNIKRSDADGKLFTFNLRMFGNFDCGDDVLAYQKSIVGKLDKEYDLWVDTNNAVILSYDKQFMNRLVGHLYLSFQKMDERMEE